MSGADWAGQIEGVVNLGRMRPARMRSAADWAGQIEGVVGAIAKGTQPPEKLRWVIENIQRDAIEAAARDAFMAARARKPNKP